MARVKKQTTLMVEKDNYYQKDFLSVNETCNYLSLKRSTIYSLMRKGEIPYYKPTGRRTLFYRKELEKWVLSTRIMPFVDYDL